MAFTLDESNFIVPELNESEADMANLRGVLFSLGDETAQKLNDNNNVDDEEEDEEEDNVEDSIMFIEGDDDDNDDDDDLIDDDEISENNDINNGRIKVFLRIRPVEIISPNYIVGDDTLIVDVPNKYKNFNGFSNSADIPSSSSDLFQFSSVLNCASQQIVFETCALPLLKSFIGGNNSLLFTYGITSSGKSFTMKGTANSPGLIPLSLVTFFTSLNHISLDNVPDYKPVRFTDTLHLNEQEKLQEDEIRKFLVNQVSCKGKQELVNFSNYAGKIEEDNSTSIKRLRSQFNSLYTNGSEISCGIWLSYYEIYNETIFDLLEIEVAGEKKSRLVLQKDSSGNNFIKGLRQVFVTSAYEAYSIFLFGQKNLERHISATNLNQRSSRSHSSFNVTFVNADYHKNTSTTSNICFCDLAGAERTNKTNNTGIRLKESSKINNSLMLLNRCIASLKSKQGGSQMAVSYRDSKLTQVFQPYLSSNGGSTYIISNLNPSENLFDESYFALKFCDNANSIQQRKVARNVRRLTQRFLENIKLSAEKQRRTLDVMRSTVDCASLNLDEATLLTQEEEIVRLRFVMDQLSKDFKQFANKKYEEEMSLRADMAQMIDNMTNQFNKTLKQKEQETEQAMKLCDKRTAVISDYYRSQIDQLNDQISQFQSELFTKNEELSEVTHQLEQFKKQINDEQDREKLILEEKNQIESLLKKKIESLEQEKVQSELSLQKKISNLEIEKNQIESSLKKKIESLEQEKVQSELSLQKKISYLAKEKNEVESSLRKKIESLEMEKCEIESSLQENIQSLKHEKNQSQSSLQEKIQILEDKFSKIKQEKVQSELFLQEKISNLEKNEVEASLRKKIESLEIEKCEIEASLKENIQSLKHEKNQSLSSLQEKIQILEDKFSKIEQEKSELMQTVGLLREENVELNNTLAKKVIQLKDRATDLDSMQIRITSQQQIIENTKPYQHKIKKQTKLIQDLENQCEELQSKVISKENGDTSKQPKRGKSKKTPLNASSLFELNISDLTQNEQTNNESEILNLFSARKDPKSMSKLQLSIRKKMPNINDSNSSLSPGQLTEIGNKPQQRYNTRRNRKKLF